MIELLAVLIIGFGALYWKLNKIQADFGERLRLVYIVAESHRRGITPEALVTLYVTQDIMGQELRQEPDE